MRLIEVLEDVDIVTMTAEPGATIAGFAYDSRRVRRGDLFFALGGTRMDGGAFVADAFAAGAAAAVVDVTYPGPEEALVRVREPRRALAQAAARLHGHPSRRLKVIGVTGTNGKTTTTYLCEGIFRAAGWRAGLIGTTGVRLGDTLRPAAFTTPEAPELQGVLAEMVARGLDAVAIELSSHALAQRRCFEVACDAAVFTNLSHDHLDYHGTMDAYLDAKLMLFDGRNQRRAVKPTTAVVNADDPAAEAVGRAAARSGQTIRTYGFGDADVAIADLTLDPDGLAFTLAERDGARTPVRLGLLGRYNAANAAAAFAAGRALGVAPAVAAAGLAAVPGVPGRLERVAAGQPFGVVVDYAHTPDALAHALAAVRAHARGRVRLVFGCGGDRDRAKRPHMGRVAAEGSERAWVTNDNPRSEAPESIAAEIVAGAPAEGRLEVVLDRRAAIAAALDGARAGDVVLIAGKGHESTQTIGTQVLPFDDRVVARALLMERAGTWS